MWKFSVFFVACVCSLSVGEETTGVTTDVTTDVTDEFATANGEYSSYIMFHYFSENE